MALDAIPRIAERLRARRSGAPPAGCCGPTGPRTPTPSCWRSARCSARSRTSSTSCATRACSIGAVGLKCFRPYPLEEVRAALAGAERVVVLEKAFAVGAGGIVGQNVRLALVGPAAARARRRRRARRAADHQGVAARPAPDAVADRLDRGLTFLDLDRELVERELRRAGDLPGPARTPRASCARSASSPRGRSDGAAARSSSTRPAASRSATACSTRSSAPCSRDTGRSNTLTSGHRACQGCGEALGARYALDAAMRASGGRLIAANATGCLEVFSTPYPESSWQLPWIHSLFGNAPAVATGVAAALKAKGREDVRVIGQGGDGGTVDIGMGCLSGMFERNDDVLFVCYDNEGYMNTGRPALRRDAAGGPHRDDPGGRRPSPATSSARARARR